MVLFHFFSLRFFLLSHIFRNFAVCDGEFTPSRQKKESSFFVLLSTFRNFAIENQFIIKK